MSNRVIGILLLIIIILYFFKDSIKELFNSSDNNTGVGKNKPIDKTIPFKEIENITLIQGTAGCYKCNMFGECKQNGYFIEILPINNKLKLENLIGTVNIDKYTQSSNSMIYYTKDVNLVLNSIAKIKEIGGTVKNSNGKLKYYHC